MDAFAHLTRLLHERKIRYVVIGVWGANHYASDPGAVFMTEDRDLFLPPDPDNLVACWAACADAGLELQSEREPLDSPRDRWLAVGRDKDRLFLATHRDALEQLLKRHDT